VGGEIPVEAVGTYVRKTRAVAVGFFKAASEARTKDEPARKASGSFPLSLSRRNEAEGSKSL